MIKNRSLLHELSWEEANMLDKNSTVLIIPIGSTEQHGPQNPLGTDFLIAEFIARNAAQKRNYAICLPTIPIGIASHHRDFAGTIWISPQTLYLYLKEIFLSLKHHNFLKVIVVNGHGGNTCTIMQIISEMNDHQEMSCLLYEWWKDEELIRKSFGVTKALHADGVETSVMWAVNPELIHIMKFKELTSSEKWGKEIGGIYLPTRTSQFTSSGIAGSLEIIDQVKGEEVLQEAIKKLTKVIDELSKSNV